MEKRKKPYHQLDSNLRPLSEGLYYEATGLATELNCALQVVMAKKCLYTGLGEAAVLLVRLESVATGDACKTLSRASRLCLHSRKG